MTSTSGVEYEVLLPGNRSLDEEALAADVGEIAQLPDIEVRAVRDLVGERNASVSRWASYGYVRFDPEGWLVARAALVAAATSWPEVEPGRQTNESR